MFMSLTWSTMWRVCVCGSPPSLMLLLIDVRLGYWHCLNSICLVMYYPITTSLLYVWLLYWICVVLWIWVLYNFLLCVEDQVQALDLWYKIIMCFHELHKQKLEYSKLEH